MLIVPHALHCIDGCLLARLDEVQEELLYTPDVGVGVGVGGGVGVGVRKKFNVKVFYVIGRALSGELSCPCDRSSLYLTSFDSLAYCFGFSTTPPTPPPPQKKKKKKKNIKNKKKIKNKILKN